jgi:hypothetical protein
VNHGAQTARDLDPVAFLPASGRLLISGRRKGVFYFPTPFILAETL